MGSPFYGCHTPSCLFVKAWFLANAKTPSANPPVPLPARAPVPVPTALRAQTPVASTSRVLMPAAAASSSRTRTNSGGSMKPIPVPPPRADPGALDPPDGWGGPSYRRHRKISSGTLKSSLRGGSSEFPPSTCEFNSLTTVRLLRVWLGVNANLLLFSVPSTPQQSVLMAAPFKFPPPPRSTRSASQAHSTLPTIFESSKVYYGT